MKKRVKFSKEFKLKAVHLSEKSDNIQDIAISLEIRFQRYSAVLFRQQYHNLQ